MNASTPRGRSSYGRALLAFALGLFGALVFAQAASATHVTPVGGSPLRVPLVPAYKPCEVGSANSQSGSPIVIPSCNPPVNGSGTVVGPQFMGFARLKVCGPCGVFPSPDIRATGSLRDVRCALTGTPPGCTAGGDYNPNGAPGPYTSAGGGTTAATPACPPSATSPSDCIAGTDLTLVAQLGMPAASTSTGNFTGHGYRYTDHYNCNPTGTPICPATATSNYPATHSDIQFPIPMDCIPTISPAEGSGCGVNTSFNALVPAAIIANQQIVIEVGELAVKDSGPDGIRGNANDQVFATQGLFAP